MTIEGSSLLGARERKGDYMLSFWQNCKKIELDAIYSRGKVGQLVIFGNRYDWGVNPDPIKEPLSQYPYHYVFTIVEKVEGENGYYILKDLDGNCIKLQANYGGACYLYDLQEWLAWNDMREKEEISCKKREIAELKGNFELLKDILIKQGIRIVTEEQAKNLGL